LPSTRVPYPFRLPTPFISAHTCMPPRRRQSRNRSSQHLARQHLNPKLPQLRQGWRRRREVNKCRSTFWLDGGDLVVPVSFPSLAPPSFPPTSTCHSFSLPRSLPPFLPPPFPSLLLPLSRGGLGGPGDFGAGALPRPNTQICRKF
jgi:hypothetical protein